MDREALLQQIIQTANDIQSLCKNHSKSPNEFVETFCVESPILHVPSPFHLVPDLVCYGVEKTAAQAISEKYHLSAKRLADQNNSVYVTALEKLCFSRTLDSSNFLSSFREAHYKTYQSTLSRWKVEILKSVEERLVEAGSGEPSPSGFDQKFVPFLEQCFSKNHRPSRTDKELLAEKTGMSYRQIHVWFQNRRSRSKKSSEITGTPKEALTRYAAASSISLADGGPLSSHMPPPYAFPGMYPPELREDPFPCRFGDFSSFGKPCWPRAHSTRQRVMENHPDVSDLVLKFEKLQLDDDSESKKKGRSNPSAPLSLAKLHREAIRPTVVRPLRAPLASLIQPGTSYLPSSSVHENELTKQSARASERREYLITRSRKPRQRNATKRIRNAVLGDHHSLPPGQSANEGPSGVLATRCKAKARRKATRSASEAQEDRKGRTDPKAAPGSAEAVEEQPTPQPSPTTSVDSLPSLSYSAPSTSSSTHSPSPTSSLATLSGDIQLSSTFDQYSLTLPPSLLTQLDDRPPSPVTFFSEGFPSNLQKGPLDYSFGSDLSGYPSYFGSFDSLSQGLGVSSEFLLPSSSELPCLLP